MVKRYLRAWMLLMCTVFAVAQSYRGLPRLPEPTVLDNWRFSIVRPVARTNLILNPSVETNTTGYTASGGSIARSTAYAYHGAYSLAVTPTAATTDGVYYTTSSLTSGTTYAMSVKVYAPNSAGRPFRIAFATNAGVILQTKPFTASGSWQWIDLLYTPTSTATLRLYVTKNGGTQTALFYIDGFQLEVCATGEYFATTYIDGDQLGLLGAVELPPFYWTGTPHASTSVRSGQTRAGGRAIPLTTYGLLVTSAQGLGMAPVQPITTPFAQLDGSQFLDLRKTDRSVTISGRWAGSTPRVRERQMASLMADLDRDLIATRQPLTILAEPLAQGLPIRAPLFIPALSYVDGMTGSLDGLPTGESIISFTQYQPRINGGDTGAALTVQQNVANSNFIVQRATSGLWSALGASGVSDDVLCMAPDLLRGYLYVGGLFATASGTSVNFIARYDISANTWAALDTTLNAQVNAIAVAANGDVYAGGDFTNAGGVANADYIARWNGSAWSALGTTTSNPVNALAIGPTGILYVGGQFTTIGGVAINRVAQWDGSVFTAMGTGASSTVQSLIIGINGYVYAGGAFATMSGVSVNGVAVWNGSAWAAMGTGLGTNSGRALAVGPDGIIYVGGQFTTAGGVSALAIARWNGVAWSALGAGLTGSGQIVHSIFVDTDNSVYAGGQFTAAGGVAVTDGAARWNGTSWVPLDMDFGSGVSRVFAIAKITGAALVFGGDNGPGTQAGLTTVTNGGTVAAYPILRITGPTAGTSRLYNLFNGNGAQIYFSTVMQVGEVITLDLRPGRLAYTSTFRGNILGDILPGSDVSTWVLQPGANTVSFYSEATTVTASLYWANDLASLEDGWTK